MFLSSKNPEISINIANGINKSTNTSWFMLFVINRSKARIVITVIKPTYL